MRDLISIVIPTFNSQFRISKCLESIQKQFLQNLELELIIVDDNSSDKTIEKVKDFNFKNYKIIKSGKNDIEYSKWIGIQNCEGEFIFFIDDDNYLCDENQLDKSVSHLRAHAKTKGVQSWKFEINPTLSLADKYAAIYGINDPFVYYLGKQDKISYFDESWILPGKILSETDSTILLEFKESEIPTIGSQGFMCRRSDIFLNKDYEKFYHMDFAIDNVSEGKIQICMLKNSVLHLHAQNFRVFFKKINRNISLFYKNRHNRKFKYNLKIYQLIKNVLILGTLVKPAADSIIMFSKSKEYASLMHPAICFVTILIYVKVSMQSIFNSALRKFRWTL
jgi:glycosyltransferase involved in cell wall biosynthesis